MCSIARAVLRCNGCPLTAVSVINKYSTSLSSSQPNADIPSAPHIIVTETADAGLLGEYMLPTLLHAANTLAPPFSVHSSRNAILIPGSAVVYAALVQDESLLCMSRADFFSSQLRPNEAYSCGKLPDSATVLTASFVGKDTLYSLSVFTILFSVGVLYMAVMEMEFGRDIVGKQHHVSSNFFELYFSLHMLGKVRMHVQRICLLYFGVVDNASRSRSFHYVRLSILVRCVTFKQVN
jgi:hypothetical protein